ncbi:MAG TPA: hypothetical protein VNZ58_12880 [Thermomicrobiales bacterium]|nr:hypothetical protein [Thermomicrobiales bacterium]
MSSDLAKTALDFAKLIQAEADEVWKPPAAGSSSRGEMVVYNSLVAGSRGYIVQIVHQINGCYENGWYDACAVMIRRLIETLIIEAFEHHDRDSQIKDGSGEFLYLRDLIVETIACDAWNLGRSAKRSLPRLKDVGDKSAHSRRYVAHRQDIDKLLPDLRDVVQELMWIAELKK